LNLKTPVDGHEKAQKAQNEKEGVETVVTHSVKVSVTAQLSDEPWAHLRRKLRPRRVPRADALPHWTRLVSYTGISSHGGPPHTDWLRRCE
jgi:hypothetical protein